MIIRLITSFAIFAFALLPVLGCKSSDKADAEPNSTMTEIDAAALPMLVKDGFAKTYPGATITKAEKETYKSGAVHYEIDYRTPAGKEGEVEFDSAGRVLPAH